MTERGQSCKLTGTLKIQQKACRDGEEVPAFEEAGSEVSIEDEPQQDNDLSEALLRHKLFLLEARELEQPKKLSPSQVLSAASGGQALRGILMSKGKLESKRITICSPKEVSLMNPRLQQINDQLEFESETESSGFLQTFDSFGYSITAGVVGRGWGFSGEAGTTVQHKGTVTHKSRFNKDIYYNSRVMYSFVPTASCELSEMELKFSPQAVKDLVAIERVIENPDQAQTKCKMFLEMYGSHVNTGLLHFGGVKTFVATYSSAQDSVTETTSSMVRDTLSAYAAMSYRGFGYSVGASVSADVISTKAGFSEKYKAEELSKTHVRNTTKGGPVAVTTLQAWLKGLQQNNNTWAMIDRGNLTRVNFVTVWDLVLKQPKFVQGERVSEALYAAWKVLTEYKNESEFWDQFTDKSDDESDDE